MEDLAGSGWEGLKMELDTISRLRGLAEEFRVAYHLPQDRHEAIFKEILALLKEDKVELITNGQTDWLVQAVAKSNLVVDSQSGCPAGNNHRLREFRAQATEPARPRGRLGACKC